MNKEQIKQPKQKLRKKNLWKENINIEIKHGECLGEIISKFLLVQKSDIGRMSINTRRGFI